MKPYAQLSAAERARVDQLVEDNWKLVYTIANKLTFYAKARGIEYDDLLQVGRIAMARAASAYDESIGTKFSTFAGMAMHRDMLYLMRRNNRSRAKANVNCVRLDAPLSDDGGSVLANLITSINSDYTRLIADEFLLRLNDRDREIVKMRMRGYGQCEIAKRFDISQTTVLRALRKAGREYEKQCAITATK